MADETCTDVDILTRKLETVGADKVAESFERLAEALAAVDAEMNKLTSAGKSVTISIAAVGPIMRAEVGVKPREEGDVRN